ncbi:S-adenosyl-L-methionine-dependent methyltransferase [Xylariaceae sp. FL1019]|nr:S-adenosyl-L-methionine-dependent methyltransferase [Xylariaceae sp. FL1019]
MSLTGNLLGNANLARVYAASTPQESQQAYDEWASNYDADMIEQGYTAPASCAKAIEAHGSINGAILDAGCGSGAIGLELSKLGAKTIDGIDFTDLSDVLDIPDALYDAMICVGTLTQGHVGPKPALSEFVRVVKSGGVIVATVLETIWEKDGYDAEVERLVKEGKVYLVSNEVQQYRKYAGVGGRVLILKRL